MKNQINAKDAIIGVITLMTMAGVATFAAVLTIFWLGGFSPSAMRCERDMYKAQNDSLHFELRQMKVDYAACSLAVKENRNYLVK